MSESAKGQSFKTLYCEVHRCAEADFTRRVMQGASPWMFRCLLVWGQFLIPRKVMAAREMVDRAGRTTDEKELTRVLNLYIYDQSFQQGAFSRFFHLRVSTSRLMRIYKSLRVAQSPT